MSVAETAGRIMVGWSVSEDQKHCGRMCPSLVSNLKCQSGIMQEEHAKTTTDLIHEDGSPDGHLTWDVRFEAFTAVTMKNAVFLDIKTQVVPHRRHYFFATEPSRLMLCKT
jgi:hypothetical protein